MTDGSMGASISLELQTEVLSNRGEQGPMLVTRRRVLLGIEGIAFEIGRSIDFHAMDCRSRYCVPMKNGLFIGGCVRFRETPGRHRTTDGRVDARITRKYRGTVLDRPPLVLVNGLAQDIRYGARVLLRSPAFAVTAIVSLALAIGATAAVFNIADAVVFRPLAVRTPEALREFRPLVSLNGTPRQLPLSAADMRVLNDATDVGTFLGFQTVDEVALTDVRSGSHTTRFELVSENYFEVLGVRPSAGRLLSRDDGTAGPVPVVISEHLWRRAFSGDASVIGRTLTLDRTPVIAVGVVRGFRGLLAERPADVFALAAAGSLAPWTRDSSGLRAVIRLHPEISPVVAEERIQTIYRRIVSTPDSMLRSAEISVTLPSARSGVSDARDHLENTLLLMFALMGTLLVVASANTGGLLLAQISARAGEFAVRFAIGAGRLRVLRQLIIEALIVTLLAAALGLLIVTAVSPLLLRAIPLDQLATDFDLRFDWRLVAFAGMLALVAAAIVAIIPVLRLMAQSTSSILSAHAPSIVRGRHPFTEGLVAAQIACSLLLLIAAGATVQTLANLNAVNPGFDSHNVAAITVNAEGRPPEVLADSGYFSQLQRRLESVAGVTRVSFTHAALTTSSGTSAPVDIPGWVPQSDEDRWARQFWVGSNLFETMHIPLLAGNGIGPQEVASQERVAVVTKAFADFYFGSSTRAIGRMVNDDIRVVGVTGDTRFGTVRGEPARAMFVPFTQAPPRGEMTFVIRADGPIAAVITACEQAVRSYDPAAHFTTAMVDDQVSAKLSRERFVARAATALAVLAVCLCCAGVYGLVAYAVSERRREFAVRLAFGATGRQILTLILRTPVRSAALGLILGIPVAFAAMHMAATLLFGVSPFDGAIAALAATGLAGATAVTALVAGRHATVSDPRTLLQSLG